MFVNLGTKIISGVVGFVVGGLLLVVALVATAFFIPMAIQGQKPGIETGNAIVSNSNVAIGAAVESIQTSKADREYGAQLQRAAAAKHLKEQKKA